MLAKDREVMEEPLQLPNRDLTRTPGETMGVLLESHFPGAKTNRGPERINFDRTLTGGWL